jgi:hypothetical protein
MDTDPERPEISSANFQRAIFLAVLSFLFFVATMLLYYIRQSMLYFLLATAFLIIYVLTMVSLFKMRRRI